MTGWVRARCWRRALKAISAGARRVDASKTVAGIPGAVRSRHSSPPCASSERYPANRVTGVAPLVARRTERLDQRLSLVEAKRRRGEPRAAGDVADREAEFLKPSGVRGVDLTHLYHPSDNLSSHHAVMMDGAGVWHYKCVFEDWLHDRLADPSRGGVDSQRVVDRLLGWFGASRLAHVQGAPVGATEGRGDALLSFEDAP